ncbi:MAG TPA: InlB B-repeat-containing protein [Spirochaetota bacterium]|nr:InlB B-repeat-containing protein [Spirochaetota bacterium]
MIKKQIYIICALMLVSFIVTACGGGSGSGGGSMTYTVEYNDNGADGGSVPVDDTEYAEGATVTVPGNTGALVKTGFVFAGWNTRADGNSDTYTEGQTFSMGSAAVTLYARWTTPGMLDTSFDPGTGADNNINYITVQGDGKILIGGAFSTYNGTARNHIARLNADGSLDTSFDPGIGADSSINSIALQGDGKILIGGDFTSYNGMARNRIARLNADGSLDTSFNPNAGASNSIYSVAVQGDGKILIGGSFMRYYYSDVNGIRCRIARANADGFLDNSFDTSAGVNDNIYSIVVQGDGKILIGGAFNTCKGSTLKRIARLNVDSTIDTSFVPTNCGAGGYIYSVALLSDGKILIAGDFTTFGFTAQNRLARLNADGSLDTSFDPGSGADTSVASMAVQGDGKILIAGHFTSYNGTSRNHIARVNANGATDISFDPGTGADSVISAIAIQDDGRILVGGGFTSYNGTSQNRIARIWN